MKFNKSIFALTAAVCLTACGDGKKTSSGGGNAILEKTYHMALANEDNYTAINAINYMLAEDSVRYGSYADTLADLYVKVNQVKSALLVSEKILKKNASNIHALEVNAISHERMGDMEESLELNRKLFDMTKRMKFQYKTAAFIFAKGDLKTARVALEKVFASKETDKDSIEIQNQEQGFAQMVPLRPAAFNLKAFIDIQEGKPADGKKAFQAALALFPEFEMAKMYLQNFDKMMQQR